VAQHVRPHASEPGALARDADQIVDRLARHRLATLGDEQPVHGRQ
jgi:hypothetical protein